MCAILEEIVKDIKSKNFINEEIIKYLKERNIDKRYWSKIITDVITKDTYKQDYSFLRMLKKYADFLALDIDSFLSLLSALVDKGFSSSGIHFLITELEIDVEKMKILYKEIFEHNNPIIKKQNGTILGKIGQKEPEFLFRIIKQDIDTVDDYKRKTFIGALYRASYLPYRNSNFRPSEDIRDLILSSIYSADE